MKINVRYIYDYMSIVSKFWNVNCYVESNKVWPSTNIKYSLKVKYIYVDIHRVVAKYIGF